MAAQMNKAAEIISLLSLMLAAIKNEKTKQAKERKPKYTCVLQHLHFITIFRRVKNFFYAIFF